MKKKSMRALEANELEQRAQHVVRDDPRFADVLAVERDGVLHLRQLAVPPHKEDWESRYTEWVRLMPIGYQRYRLAHCALTARWQELDVEGTLEECLHAIMHNRYHLFFG
jgi:hypothetical protein